MLDPSTVPQELRNKHQWVCWRKEEREANGRTKVDKIPITHTGSPASHSDKLTWCGFEEARAASTREPGIAGVGFVFTPDDPYCGIDFDDCLSDGVPSDEILKWVERLDSWTEVSQSGRGLHVVVRATLPDGRGRKSGVVELYDRSRFFVVTGNDQGGRGIRNAQDVVDQLLAEYFSGSTARYSDSEFDRLKKEIEEILKRGAQPFNAKKLSAFLENDQKFKSTWYRRRREWSDDDSASRYDAALAWHGLAADLSTEEIVSLITTHRELHNDDPKGKCGRSDYLARTILWCQSGEVTNERQLIRKIDETEVDDVKRTDDQSILDKIRKATGIDEIAGCVKFGFERGVYFLSFTDGRLIEVGNSGCMLRKSVVNAVILDGVGKTMRQMKGYKWEQVTQWLVHIADVREIEDNDRTVQLYEWLSSYLSENHPVGDDGRANAVMLDAPFYKDGHLHVRVGDLRKFICGALSEKVGLADLRVLLKFAGYTGKAITVWVPSIGRSVCRYYYHGVHKAPPSMSDVPDVLGELQEEPDHDG